MVVTDPANARFLMFLQSGKTGLGASQTFPGLVGGKTVKLADLDGDGKAEVYVLSEQEKQVGRSVLADGRLTFPTPLPLTGEPVALELAELDGDKSAEVLYVARNRVNGTDEFTLRAVQCAKIRHVHSVPLGTGGRGAVEGLVWHAAGLAVPRRQPRRPDRFSGVQRFRAAVVAARPEWR